MVASQVSNFINIFLVLIYFIIMGVSVVHLIAQSFRKKYDIRSLVFTGSLFLLGLFIRVSLDYDTNIFEQLKLEIQFLALILQFLGLVLLNKTLLKTWKKKDDYIVISRKNKKK